MSTFDADIANRPLIICGMHRSGTSLTASLFGGAGVNLGERLFGPNVGNALGHFEDVGFLEFHMRALRVLGHNLEGYVTRPLADLPAELVAEGRQLVAERMEPARLWGWKEPRTTLFLDYWDTLIPEARYVFVFRKPWDVADSLFRRGDAAFVVDPRLALELWLTYNQRIADFIARHPTRCVLFEISQLIADPPAAFSAVRTQLGIPIGEPPDCFRHGLFGRECNPNGADVVRCLIPEAFELYDHLRRQVIGTPGSRTHDSQDEGCSSDPVEPAALARYTIEEWARASRAAVRERTLRAEVAAAAEREEQLAAAAAASLAEREGLATEFAALAAKHERLALRMQQIERERDQLAREKQELRDASERLARALAEASESGPLRRLAGWLQKRSSTGRAA